MSLESAEETAEDDENDRRAEIEAKLQDLRERVDMAAQEATDARNNDEIAELKSEIDRLESEKQRLQTGLEQVGEELSTNPFTALLKVGGIVLVLVVLAGIAGNGNTDDTTAMRGPGQF